jgi:hypothetical protein
LLQFCVGELGQSHLGSGEDLVGECPLVAQQLADVIFDPAASRLASSQAR